MQQAFISGYLDKKAGFSDTVEGWGKSLGNWVIDSPTLRQPAAKLALGKDYDAATNSPILKALGQNLDLESVEGRERAKQQYAQRLHQGLASAKDWMGKHPWAVPAALAIPVGLMALWRWRGSGSEDEAETKPRATFGNRFI
jgi:hypothetical protein